MSRARTCSDRARLAGHRVGGLDLGVALDGVAHLGRGHPALAVERHERVRAPAEAAGVDAGRVAADHAVGLEPVDAPLDRRRRQRDAQADALERAPRVLPEQRNDLPVDVVHTGADDRTSAQRIALDGRDSAIMKARSMRELP